MSPRGPVGLARRPDEAYRVLLNPQGICPCSCRPPPLPPSAAASATPSARLSPPSPAARPTLGSVLLLEFLCYRDLTSDPYLELHEPAGGPPLLRLFAGGAGSPSERQTTWRASCGRTQAGPGTPPRRAGRRESWGWRPLCRSRSAGPPTSSRSCRTQRRADPSTQHLSPSPPSLSSLLFA
jgi:hypothetical protein